MPTPDPLSWDLETWSKGFYGVYAINDDEKSYSAIWLSATSHASTVAEAVRLNDCDEIIYTLGNVFAWVLSFVERFRLDLVECEAGKEVLKQRGGNWTEWILHKFPSVCHICGETKCICASFRDVMELRRDKRKTEYEKIMSRRNDLIEQAFQGYLEAKKSGVAVPQLFDMFESIYGGTLWGVGLSDVSFHFLEEIGEVSKEITYLEGIAGRTARKEWQGYVTKKGPVDWAKYSEFSADLARELADVFSWTTALCFKAAQVFKPTAWQPREALIKLYTGEVFPPGKKRKSVEVSIDNFKFVCRYCGGEECSQRCIQEQVQKHFDEGLEETKKKFGYETATSAVNSQGT